MERDWVGFPCIIRCFFANFQHVVVQRTKDFARAGNNPQQGRIFAHCAENVVHFWNGCEQGNANLDNPKQSQTSTNNLKIAYNCHILNPQQAKKHKVPQDPSEEPSEVSRDVSNGFERSGKTCCGAMSLFQPHNPADLAAELGHLRSLGVAARIPSPQIRTGNQPLSITAMHKVGSRLLKYKESHR